MSLVRGGSSSKVDSYEIYRESDLGAVNGYSNGVITVADGVFLTIDQTSANITSDVEFVLEGNAELRITSRLAKASWNYTKSGGVFISGGGIRASMYNIELVSTGSSSTFINTFNCTLNLDGCAIAGFDNLGDMTGTGLTAFDLSGARSFVDDFAVGLNLNNMVVNSDVLVLTSFRLVGAAVNIKNDIPLPLVSSFVNAITFLRPQNSVFKIDPISSDNFRMSVSLVQRNGGEALFETSGGANGTFTAVADGSVSLGISSVSPNGDGRARFTLSSGDVYIGQTVTISGYTTNTDYNGTFVILDVPVAGAFVIDADYGSDEVGGQADSSVLTLTDAGTSITDGVSATISTDNALTYDGGKNVFNVQANTFQINGAFEGTASGIWNTNPLDETAPNITAFNNPSAADSAATAEVSFTAGVTTTNIPAAGANVLISSPSWIVKSTQRFKTESTGGVIYFGLEPTSTLSDGNISLEPANSSKTLSSQFVNIKADRVSCTFSTANDAVTTPSSHGLSVGDTVTFKNTGGAIDTALRDDVIYYVQAVLSATEYTVSYTDGGALIALTGGSSGDTSYAAAVLSGSRPQNLIAANSPRTLVPQALGFLSTGDTPYTVVSNEDDATDVIVSRLYYRVSN